MIKLSLILSLPSWFLIELLLQVIITDSFKPPLAKFEKLIIMDKVPLPRW